MLLLGRPARRLEAALTMAATNLQGPQDRLPDRLAPTRGGRETITALQIIGQGKSVIDLTLSLLAVAGDRTATKSETTTGSRRIVRQALSYVLRSLSIFSVSGARPVFSV